MADLPPHKIRKIIRATGGETRSPGRVLTCDPTRAGRFFDPRTGKKLGPDSPFAKAAIKAEKEAAKWKL